MSSKTAENTESAKKKDAWISAREARLLLAKRIVDGELKPLHECTLRRRRKRGLIPFRKINGRVYLYPLEMICKIFGVSKRPKPSKGIDRRKITAELERKAKAAAREELREELLSYKAYLASTRRNKYELV